MDNPKAFPKSYSSGGHDGMTLRDYFAAKALGGMASTLNEFPSNKSEIKQAEKEIKLMADYAYIMADAMLEARNKDNGK